MSVIKTQFYHYNFVTPSKTVILFFSQGPSESCKYSENLPAASLCLDPTGGSL